MAGPLLSARGLRVEAPKELSVTDTRSRHAVGLGYKPALDGIRAIAVALVVGYHYFDWPPGGSTGVDVFFVLSGFLITTLLIEDGIRGFYQRRIRRLLPALAVMLAVYLVVSAAAGDDRIRATLVGGTYIANLADASGYRLLYTSHLNHLWSLAEEEQFYLVWPWALLLALRTRRPAWVVSGLAVALVVYRAILDLHGASGYRIYYGPDTRADALLIGALLALARPKAAEWAGQIGLCAIIPAALVGWQFSGWAVWGEPLFAVCMALLVAACVAESELARGLSVKPLVWIGKRSYGLYLWHLPVLGAAYYGLGHDGTARFVALGAALGISALSYRFIEKPFRRQRESVRPRASTGRATAAL